MAKFNGDSKMRSMINENPSLLTALSRFGIPLGFGDRCVSEICRQHGIDVDTFLTVTNYISSGHTDLPADPAIVHTLTLMGFLKNAHEYFLDFLIPRIKRKLIEAIDCSGYNEVGMLIIKQYDEFSREVNSHLRFENEKVFPYVEKLLQGRRDPAYSIARFASNHHHIAPKLQELKDIIIRYYPGSSSDLLTAALYDIFLFEQDIDAHCRVEDDLFVPAVQRLEQQTLELCPADPAPAENPIATRAISDPEKVASLSRREKEIISLIAKGLSTKEIASALYLSTHTVTTHRRNICTKLHIHSPAGLAIFAIANNLA